MLSLSRTSVTLYFQFFFDIKIDGELQGITTESTGRTLHDVKVWAGDGKDTPADAKIRNLVYQ